MDDSTFLGGSSSSAAPDSNLGALATLLRHQIVNQEQFQRVERIRQARQAISSKLGRFDGKNITRFIKVYEQIMEDNGVENDKIMENFEKVSEPDLRERINELRNEDDDTWQTFKTALKEEYFLEDEDRVTK